MVDACKVAERSEAATGLRRAEWDDPKRRVLWSQTHAEDDMRPALAGKKSVMLQRPRSGLLRGRSPAQEAVSADALLGA